MLAGRVEALDRPALVGLDGGDAAGKTILAAELASRLPGAVRASLDDFHHRRRHRHALGRTAETVWSRTYDLEAVRRELLDPWRRGAGAPYRRRWHDLDSDRHVDEPLAPVPAGGVLLVDGLFRQRFELVDAWDLVVYVHADDGVRVARMATRDGAPGPSPPGPTSLPRRPGGLPRLLPASRPSRCGRGQHRPLAAAPARFLTARAVRGTDRRSACHDEPVSEERQLDGAVLRMCAGDGDAFRQVYRAVHPALLRYLEVLVGPNGGGGRRVRDVGAGEPRPRPVLRRRRRLPEKLGHHDRPEPRSRSASPPLAPGAGRHRPDRPRPRRPHRRRGGGRGAARHVDGSRPPAAAPATRLRRSCCGS